MARVFIEPLLQTPATLWGHRRQTSLLPSGGRVSWGRATLALCAVEERSRGAGPAWPPGLAHEAPAFCLALTLTRGLPPAPQMPSPVVGQDVGGAGMLIETPTSAPLPAWGRQTLSLSESKLLRIDQKGRSGAGQGGRFARGAWAVPGLLRRHRQQRSRSHHGSQPQLQAVTAPPCPPCLSLTPEAPCGWPGVRPGQMFLMN